MTVIEDPPTTTEEQPRVVALAEKSPDEIFRWSRHVHVGSGAAECAHAEDGKCRDPRHFHAWIRLPNPFQVRDIAEKSRAARARVRRALRDEDSDQRVTLEDELAETAEGDLEALINELLDRDFVEDYGKATEEVMDLDEPGYVPEDEDDEIPKLYGDVDQDREEYMRQRELPEDKRSDGYADLEKHLAAFNEQVQARLVKIQEPRRENLRALPVNELIDIVRKDRISNLGADAYLHTFNTWTWYVCTFRPSENFPPGTRVWKDVNDMRFGASREVISTLRNAFDKMERQLAGETGKGF